MTMMRILAARGQRVAGAALMAILAMLASGCGGDESPASLGVAEFGAARIARQAALELEQGLIIPTRPGARARLKGVAWPGTGP
jgi:hypothetical protein